MTLLAVEDLHTHFISRSLDNELTSARKASRSSGRASIGMTIFESDSCTFVMPNMQS